MIGGLASAALAGDVLANPIQPKQKSPNIIFILADDLGYADVGCYGRGDIHTPHIDSLATSGVRFTQAYANSAVCSATRTALITGRYQYRLRLGLEEPLANAPDIGLPPEHPTLPSLLRQLGYGTTLIGKWHLGALPKFGPLQSGYDHFYGHRGGAVDYLSHKGSDGRADLWENDVPVERTGYMTQMLGDRAVQVVDQYAAQAKPFLISLHFNAPHWPWELPGDALESQRIAGTPLFHYDGGSQQIYRSMIEVMDTQIGRVLQALQRHGLRDNTIVIFTSDNGGERFSDVWPFSGHKTELLEGGLRVPAIVSWPARLPKKQLCAQTAMSMDWLPTLLAAAGGAPDPAYPSDGMNLMPQLQQAHPVMRKLYWRYKSNHQRALRDGDYKFLKMLDSTYLFNVVDDPQERANLKARHPDIYQRLLNDWQAWNHTMLPEVAESFGGVIEGRYQADHTSAGSALLTPDNTDL